MAPLPPVGWVVVTASDPPVSVSARLAEDRPDVSGYGGWDEVARPRRRPLTTFKALPGLHLTLPLLLDGWADNASVEADIASIERLGTATGSDGEPPRVRVTARGSAVPHQDRTWVIGDIVWGDALMNGAGNRTRQQVTLTLYEYVEDLHLAEKSAAARRRTKAKARKKAGASAKRIVIKHGKAKRATHARSASTTFGTGEDLLSIAARELGDADRWVEIAQLNGLRDPRATTPGQEIRLP